MPTMNQTKKLTVLYRKSSGNFVALDPTNSSKKNIEPHGIKNLFNSSMVVLKDAKSLLNTVDYFPSPHHKVICLKTIKMILNLDEEQENIAVTLDKYFDQIKKHKLSKLISLECQVIPATIAMEKKGLPFDKELWLKKLEDIKEQTQQLKAKLTSMLNSSKGFMLFEQKDNLNDAKWLKEALEKRLGKKLESTSKNSLEGIDDEVAKALITYRENSRFLSAYGEEFLQSVKNGRLHGCFNPLGTSSGRFSCQKANLLALPNHFEFQEALLPKDPYTIVKLDFSGFELRILASLSGDKKLMEIFADNKDIHSEVAKKIFAKEVSKDINPHLREQAKIINFGLIYGMGKNALSQKLAVAPKTAQGLMDSYFSHFTGVKEYLLSLEKKAFQQGFVSTALSRRLYFNGIEDEGHIRRVARNMPIQGTGADIIKLAFCNVFREFHDLNKDAHVVNVVHDEIVVECLIKEKQQIAKIAKQSMEQAFCAILKGPKPEIAIK